MTPILTLLMSSMVGINVGWFDVPGEPGRRDYVIQVEPELLDRLKAGEHITSAVLPGAGHFTHIRIQVGEGPLSRDKPDSPAARQGNETDSSNERPPVPNLSVLEIAESPELVAVDFAIEPVAPVLATSQAGDDVNTGDDRESEFSISSDFTEQALAGDDAADESLPELSAEEIEGTAELQFDGPPSATQESSPLPLVAERPTTERVESPVGKMADPGLLNHGVATAIHQSPVPVGEGVGREAESSRPWLPLVLAVMGLLASLGGNAYLVCLFAGLYRRHKVLSNKYARDAGDTPGR